MTLTLADVAKWNPEAIRDVAKALTKKGASAQEVADGLGKLPIIASWEGKTGDAAKASVGALATFLTNHAEQMESLNQALLAAADEVENVRGDLGRMQSDADNKHFDVNYETGAVTATDATNEATAAADKAKLETDVAKILATANTVDQSLATALSNAIGAPTATVDQTPGSLPYVLDTVTTPPEPSERFSAAERYIFNEIATNRDSATARELKTRLTPPVSLLDAGFAARDFYNKVRSGGVWDHKHQIEDLFGIASDDKLDANHYFQIPGTKKAVLYDVYSNIHYGYIGRLVGIPPENLIWVTGLNTEATGTNDDGDNITMRAGVALYDKYGPNMTAEQFHTGLMDVVNQLDAAQRAGQNVPQIKALP
ncbi:MAG: polymorphic toxin type 44 domain-containing protein [Mycobacterium sp.]